MLAIFSGRLRGPTDNTQIATPPSTLPSTFHRSAFTSTIRCPLYHSLEKKFFRRFARNLTGQSMKSEIELFSASSKATCIRILLGSVLKVALPEFPGVWRIFGGGGFRTGGQGWRVIVSRTRSGI